MKINLKGLKVVELATVLAGPAVGRFFAELGANVIKIEHPENGDVTRSWKLTTEDPNASDSAYFHSVNWGKDFLKIDISTPLGQEHLFQLLSDADILLTNFKAASAAKLGLSPTDISQRFPKLIYGCITGFPNDTGRVAYDIVLQAEAGFLYMTGEENSNSVRMPVALIDIIAAHQLKEAILLALLQRHQTGEGAYLEVSLLETAISSLANQATNYLVANHIPQKMGTQHPNIAPYGELMKTADNQQIVLAVGSQQQFNSLCRVLGLEYLLEMEEYQSNRNRVKNRTTLASILQEVFLKQNADYWMELLNKNQVPAGLVRDMASVFELPEAQNLIQKTVNEEGLEKKSVRTFVAK